MKKENVKTYALVLLIICSIGLTGKIWFEEKLWPEGYNFFSVIKDKFSFGDGEFVSSLTKETISFPNTVIVNNVEKRSIYTDPGEAYTTIATDAKSLIRLALESTALTPVDAGEWSMAIKSRSIHVTYPVAYDSRLFLNILGSYKTDGISIPVKEFIISSGDSVSSNVNVYIRNHDTSEVLKAPVKWDKKSLDDLIVMYAADSIGDLSYSTELNFDKTNDVDGTNVEQKVFIEPTVPIQLNRKLTNMVRSVNPLYEHEFDSDVVSHILKQFEYNTSGAKKYTERDNSVVYVENYSTLKLHPNGLVEYKAIDRSKGISLGSTDFYGNLLACVDFVNLMWQDVFPDRPLNINISSDVIDAKSKSFTLTMEYFADGIQVVTDIPQTGTHGGMGHGVEIEVYEGRIVSYKQYFAIFEPAGMSSNSVSAIDALDELLSRQDLNDQSVEELYPVYVSAQAPYYLSSWAVKTSTGQSIIID